MTIKERIRKNKADSKNYPIKSGLLLSDIIIIFMCGFFVCGFLYIGKESGITTLFILSGIIGIIVAVIGFISFYFSSYKILKKYEKEHGSTHAGDNYLRN